MILSWKEIAQQIVSVSTKNGPINKENHLAVIAAKALIAELQPVSHPSYCNTVFAIAALTPDFDHFDKDKRMEFLAFNLLVNGLSGYFQWVSHNGGEFSVANALLHHEVITAEEAKHLEQFQVCCTHDGCKYFIMHDDFLARIAEKWKLPLLNTKLGGKKERNAEDYYLLERMKQEYPFSFAGEKEMIREALTRL